jgi:putative phage-type endonuclease
MPIIVDSYAQGSPEWFAARLGSIGGSSIASVVAKGEGKMRANLLYRLAGEILSGVKYDGYKNENMERGNEQEADARSVYAMECEVYVRQVGIVKESQHTHYSPDGLVDPDGIIEIKCVIPSVHVETIVTEKIKGEYYKQIQWGVHICQRQWCDFISWSPLIRGREIWIKRYDRDEKLIKELVDGADKFIIELLAVVERMKE